METDRGEWKIREAVSRNALTTGLVICAAVIMLAAPCFGVRLACAGVFFSCFVRQKKREALRVQELTVYLERANAGSAPVLSALGEDELSKLEDQIYKTVTYLYQTREEAVRTKNEFARNLSNIAHQIKTPITTVSLVVQTMEERDGGEEKEEREQIMKQLTRLTHLEEALLLLARLDAGTLVLKREATDVYTLLVLAATLLSFVSVMVSFSSVDMEEIAAEMPEFTLENGHLNLDEDFLFDEGSVFIYMTEDIDSFSYDDADEIADEGYRDVMLVGRDRISILQNGEYQQLDYSDLGSSFALSREWIATKLAPFIKMVIFLLYIVYFLWRILWYFLCAAVYMLFAMIIASAMHKQVPGEALFKTAVYAKVLMFVIAALLDLLPVVYLAVPFLFRVAVTIVFMGVAIMKLPDNRPPPAVYPWNGSVK